MKQFKAESKRLLDLMINSIYTHKEIFLRELISNASDAIDKVYYIALTDDKLTFNKEDYYIRIIADKKSRTLTVADTGIGMDKEELENNLGVIAKSGSLTFKGENEVKDDHEIIGQFGVGFYSAFMVSDCITVTTKKLGEETAYKWESKGAAGYTIEETTKDAVGTEIVLHLKENTDDDRYDEYLEEFRIKSLIKKYSDFIRYPIKMLISKKEDDKDVEFEDQTLNSMVPLWRKNKNEISEEDYENFYQEKHFGFDKPLKHIHVSVDGTVSYNALMYIPSSTPYDLYTKEYEKGLELYSSGVLIMNKCGDLLPDYFGFVKGLVDSSDLSLNISREILQHDRQLKFIAKRLREKIKNELLAIQKNDRETYEKFFEAFGRSLKYGVYSDYGMNKEVLEDLIMFYSSKEKKQVTLDEYVSRMKEDQKYIYFASGDSIERIDKLPQTEMVKESDYEILYFTDDVDEFAVRMLNTYKEKEFKSVSSKDTGIENKVDEKIQESNKELFECLKEELKGKVSDVKASNKLKSHAVCLSSAGDLSIEMEKVLNMMPNNEKISADKVLEINVEHNVFEAIKKAYEEDKDKLKTYANLLYDQALLIEGLPIEDPVEFTNNICKLMK